MVVVGFLEVALLVGVQLMASPQAAIARVRKKAFILLPEFSEKLGVNYCEAKESEANESDLDF